MKPIAHGIYDALIDEYLKDALTQHPELRTVFGKIDHEEQPAKVFVIRGKGVRTGSA